MINLPISAGYAFDHLSINEVKLSKSNSDNCAALQKICNFYANNLAEQIGDRTFKEIINSSEYLALKETNKILFETIENCKNYEVSARTVDLLNHKRWQLKSQLQKKFFGDGIGEIKIGY